MWSNRNNRLLIILGIVIIIIAGMTLFINMVPSDYVMFIYKRDDAGEEVHVVEVRSYKNRRECMEDQKVFNMTMNGKSMSYARCASGCSLAAENENECKNVEK